jgi:predicted metal-dependent RNase
MKLIFCGGAEEVGASCLFFQIDGKNFLFDCGMRMTKAKDNLPDFRIIQENGGINGIFVSHAHMDHIGALPVISREYPDAPIFCTFATKDLIRVLLYDSLKIMEKQEAEIPVFSEGHVVSMLNRILCYNPGNEIRITDDIKAMFFNAGHILGAASVYITSKEGSFFYSGDFSVTPQLTVEGAAIPKLRPDVAVFESTYGDRLHSNRQNEEKRLVETVRKTIEDKGKILIPAFALGRAQEVILILKRAMNKNELPEIPVYIDGMVKDVCTIYENNPNYLRSIHAKKVLRGSRIFTDDNFRKVTDHEMRKQILESSEPCCIVSSSGMLTGGPSQDYAKALFTKENNFIAITGYQDEEAPGRSLLALAEAKDQEEKVITIDGVHYEVKCGVGKYGLSAHADKSQITALVESLAPRRIFFNHGEASVIRELAGDVAKNIYAQIIVPSNGEVFDMNIRNPRKQIQKEKPASMGRPDPLTEENIPILREYILSLPNPYKGFTVEEIHYLWYGEDPKEEQAEELNRLLNGTRYFKHDFKRTYIFLPATEDELMESVNDGIMEINEMLRFADEFFPKEAGLSKKGARYEEKIALLSFDYPKMAKERYGHLIKEFEEKTGWSVEVNEQCNTNAAKKLITVLLERYGLAPGKISHYQETDTFAVKTSKTEKKEEIENRFFELTGLPLKLEEEKGLSVPINVLNGAKAEEPLEQNRAMTAIDLFFQDKKHKPYKKSVKISKEGKTIELSFITPKIGERYEKEMKELSRAIGWPLSVNPSTNDFELTMLARKILEDHGVKDYGKISFHKSEGGVKVKNVSAPEEVKMAVQKDFFEETGFLLIL